MVDSHPVLKSKMHFSHTADIWGEFPDLVPLVMHVRGVRPDAPAAPQLEAFHRRAHARLQSGSEGELPEIQAWRRSFARMGLKPTQYRCAAESLLRRLRKEGALPGLHPLIDLCNAASMAYAVPIAVFDLAQVADPLQVSHASGTERYQDFSGAIENPQAREVVFVDGAGNAHARRWCHRQSGLSAVTAQTTEVLIVAEAQHAGAVADLQRLAGELAPALGALGASVVANQVLTRQAPLFAA
jgi:DNA/RNA-binding domain of Phe-tRNA-synthetase-like protein